MTAADGGAPRPAGAVRRFLLLLDLRRRLVFRGPGRGVGAKILFTVALAPVLVFAAVAGVGTHRLAERRPELADDLVRLVFLSVFGLQLAVGVLGVAISEFFDTSRLLHLPVGPRELFAAMSVSALFSPMNLFAVAPIIGVLAATGGGPATIALQAAVFLALLWFAHVAALAVGFALLRLFSRRRLRDLTTIAGSVLGVGVYIGFRAIGGGGDGRDVGATLAAVPWDKIAWIPSQWFAEIFVAVGAGRVPAAVHLAAALLALPLLLHAGATAFRAGYDAAGEGGPGEGAVAEVRSGLARLLPADIASVFTVTTAIFRREPQLRAQLIQQFVFLAAPVLMSTTGGSAGGRAPSESFTTFFVPLMIVMSHGPVALSWFGVDGRGLAALFAAPIPRTRLLLGRALALLAVFAALDVFAASAAAVALRLLRGGLSEAPFDAARFFGMALAGDVVQLACGAVLSAVAPTPVVRARRVAGRLGREGCFTLASRGFILLPVGLLGALVVGVALLPRWFDAPPAWWLASGGLALLLAVGILAAGIALGARLLEPREAKVLAALVDAGD